MGKANANAGSGASAGASAGAVAALAALTGVSAIAIKELDKQYFVLKDAQLLYGLSKLGAMIQYNMLTKWTVATGLEEAAVRFNGKDALVFEDQIYSFSDWNDLANASARYLRSLGIKQHDVVAVYMLNRPEFIFVWSGLVKLGAVGALINTNLKNKPLLHCLKVSGAKHVVFGAECADNVGESLAELREGGFQLHCETSTGAAPSWCTSSTQRFAGHSKAAVPLSWRAGTGFDSNALLIFTSGTTGLPKPAVLKHAKIYGAGAAFGIQFGIRGEDRIYNSGLPLYHSAATNIGGGLCLIAGCTLVIRSKFSASQFFEDCTRYRCTVVQYIGELCRYLLNSPKGKFEREHRVRLAVGNGLRPEIWPEFQQRFGIREIGEFYGSSEGNIALFNHSKDAVSRGAIGHMGILMRQLGFCTILKFDPEREEVVRDPATGFCIEAADGEAGEAVAEIKDRPAGTFDGYHGDEAQTKKKILNNVFKKGDRYFRSGDLLMKDKRGYYFFVDRIGDTFRWKAENVSTTEVAGIVGNAPGVLQANVYGVQIPGKDGRACCAAVTTDDSLFDLDKLHQVCKAQLPAYAQPLFVRKLQEMDTTGTFKVQKVALRQEGVDPSKVKDPLFFFDHDANKYVPMDMNVYARVVTGKARL
jgi:fatty-acyl-CoA synthase